MLIHSNKEAELIREEADICIMGGGVAGLTLANELKHQFDRVVVLEAGEESLSMESQLLYAAGESNPVFRDPSLTRLRMLGGSSNHWENNTSPFDPIDFERRDWIADSGWPISFDDLKNFYRRAEPYVGVGDDGYELDYWLKFLNAKDVLKGSKILETGFAKAANPATRYFMKHGSMILDSSNVTIYKHATVVDVEFDQQQRRVTTAYFESQPGRRHQIKAKAFVMCFGGLENARMLLEFNRKYNDTLGNQHDNVGRYFMDHPTVRAAHFFAKDPAMFNLYKLIFLNKRKVKGFFKLTPEAQEKYQTINLRMPISEQTKYIMSDGISSHHIIGDAIGQGKLPDDFGTHIWNYVKDIDMVAEAVFRKKFNKNIVDDADTFGGYEVAVMVEQCPYRENRIRLSKMKDEYGLHRLAIDWKLHDEDKERFWKTLELTGMELGALSLGRLKVLREREERLWNDQIAFGHHHMGTTKMSFNEKNGVVDKDCKLYGTNNFYIGGSSVFPTGGHVPPTLTIVAMSIRLAEQLKKEWRNA